MMGSTMTITTSSHTPITNVTFEVGSTFSPYLPCIGQCLKFRKWGSQFVNLRRNSTQIQYFSAISCLRLRNEGVMKEKLVGDKDGVIIVDHGSRRKESNVMLNEFVTMFRGRTQYHIVEPAHMELAQPSIRDAFRLCVRQGANRIIVSPFFLFPGRHWHQDIPSLVAEAANEHPGVSYLVTAPLGLHELLVDVMNERIKHCLNHAAGDGNECSACTGSGGCHFY